MVDSGGTFLRDLRAHLNQNAARMLLLLLRLLLQLLLGVEAPMRHLPLTMPQGLSEAFLMLRSACPSACASVALHVAHYPRFCFGDCSHLWLHHADALIY